MPRMASCSQDVTEVLVPFVRGTARQQELPFIVRQMRKFVFEKWPFRRKGVQPPLQCTLIDVKVHFIELSGRYGPFPDCCHMFHAAAAWIRPAAELAEGRLPTGVVPLPSQFVPEKLIVMELAKLNAVPLAPDDEPHIHALMDERHHLYVLTSPFLGFTGRQPDLLKCMPPAGFQPSYGRKFSKC